MTHRFGRMLALTACLSLVAVPATLARDAVDVPAAVHATVASGSLGVDMEFSLSGMTQAGSQTLLMTATGAMELDGAPRMRLAMDMTDYDLGLLDVILVDRFLYVRADSWAEEQGDDSWLGMDLDSTDTAVDDFRDLVSGQNDASLALYWLLGATAPPAAVGQERVGDTLAQRLVLHLDLDLALDQVPAHARPLLERIITEARARDIEPLFEADVWVGDDGLVHRATYAFEDLPPGVTDMHVTYDFRDFGEPVDLEVPDAEDVVVIAGQLPDQDV